MRSSTELWTEDGRLHVNERVGIPAAELTVRATRSGGPGGQHVNTSSTRVEIIWNVPSSTALSDEERDRLLERLASKLDSSGSVRIVASDTRSQARNRELALQRLAGLVRQALVVRKKRRPTRPSAASKRARLDAKKRQSEKKRGRRQERNDTE